jgi:hypothetical protein
VVQVVVALTPEKKLRLELLGQKIKDLQEAQVLVYLLPTTGVALVVELALLVWMPVR